MTVRARDTFIERLLDGRLDGFGILGQNDERVGALGDQVLAQDSEAVKPAVRNCSVLVCATEGFQLSV